VDLGESRVRIILQVLHSLSAIDRNRAVGIRELASLANLNADELRNILSGLRGMGYVEFVDEELVYLTTSAIIKLSSTYC
jgi:DNA-binding IclR family transcriptional regulator